MCLDWFIGGAEALHQNVYMPGYRRQYNVHDLPLCANGEHPNDYIADAMYAMLVHIVHRTMVICTATTCWDCLPSYFSSSAPLHIQTPALSYITPQPSLGHPSWCTFQSHCLLVPMQNPACLSTHAKCPPYLAPNEIVAFHCYWHSPRSWVLSCS